ncbi:MAG: type II toxin-antitoxin system PemK/MazF family toxin [Myxococcota bacterium]|nr:type II toxin-antitoxin system PemK/MazF family toxin [Myxococcota bacterium]
MVFVPFPFTDLSTAKLRPALVLAHAGRVDWPCLQITSRPYADPYAIEMTEQDFASGSLHRTSFIRPGKLFTAHRALFLRVVGHLHDGKLEQVRERVVELVRNGSLTG